MPDTNPRHLAAHADPALPRAIITCRRKLALKLPPRDVDRLARYLGELGKEGIRPPGRGRGFDWDKIGAACSLPPAVIEAAKDDMLPALRMQARAGRRIAAARTMTPRHRDQASGRTEDLPDRRKPPGRKPHTPVEFPTASPDAWDDPPEFHRALALHMKRHGDSSWRLHAAVTRHDERFNYSTILTWRRGQKAPQDALSFSVLARIEHRYRLPDGYFTEKLKSAPRATRGEPVLDIAPSEMRRLAWHLPNDLRDRPLAEQEEIVAWVRSVIISGATDYRRFQASAMKQRYGLRFATQLAPARTAAIDLRAADLKAPAALDLEMEALVSFKTSTLTLAGYARSGVWGAVTADQRTEHLSLLFGALAAASDGPVRGRGIPSNRLTLGLLLFPAIWDWYVQWRERRRGFYTSWESDLLHLGVALVREKTGWLRQTPSIAARLLPIEGLVTLSDIESARSDWDGACDRLYAHGLARAKEIERVARVHRDPFEPILPILEADSPLGEYRKITEEIVRRMPDARRYPKAVAEAVRGFLMLRIGLHTGLRQKNLRQLLVCHRGVPQRSERQLTDARRGELRWNERETGWEVLIPSAAFKNANSSFFGNRPFRLVLPDLGGLYDMIDVYLMRHRAVLLAGRSDPDTFFVKTMKVTSREAAYDQNTFYEAWRLTIQRYGIYNPYTDRGAIKGLLPHGPHNVRDVLATHILKQTGSYEQASYAIQDTPEMVAKHYGRFLPQDKAALAAQVLNKVWA